MSLSTIQTIYTPSIIATVPADDTFTNAFALNEPGLYELSCPGFDWYYGTAPGLPLGSMTLVPAGATASFTIAFGDPTITRWVRGAPTIPALINVLYTPSLNGTAGATGFTVNDNTAYGLGAGTSFAADLQRDTAIGYNALNACTTGADNTAVGYKAGQNVTVGYSNTLIGAAVAPSLSTGYENIFIGQDSGAGAATAYSNVAIGTHAFGEAVGNFNVAIGTRAMGAVSSGSSANTIVGGLAGQNMAATSYNSFFGFSAGFSITSGTNNVAVGALALMNVTGASSDNTAIGYLALGDDPAIGAGYNNTAVGSTALSKTAGGNSTAVGYRALRLATGDFNTAVGALAGANQTTPLYNVLVGYGAGSSISTGGNNTAMGALAGSGITTATDCVAIGKNAMQQGPVTGNGNIAIGTATLDHIGGGARNIAIGSNAGASEIVGNGNVFIGESAGQNSTESSQTLVGDFAGYSFNSGIGNTALGYGAIQNATTGSHNIAIGANAGAEIIAGSENIMLGQNAGIGLGDLSNALVIGNTSNGPITTIWINAANPNRGPTWRTPVTFSTLAYFYASPSAPTDANLTEETWTAWVDMVADKLTFRVRYTDGSYKTGTVNLI